MSLRDNYLVKRECMQPPALKHWAEACIVLHIWYINKFSISTVLYNENWILEKENKNKNIKFEMIALPELTADCLKLMIIYRSKVSCLLFLGSWFTEKDSINYSCLFFICKANRTHVAHLSYWKVMISAIPLPFCFAFDLICLLNFNDVRK